MSSIFDSSQAGLPTITALHFGTRIAIQTALSTDRQGRTRATLPGSFSFVPQRRRLGLPGEEKQSRDRTPEQETAACLNSPGRPPQLAPSAQGEINTARRGNQSTARAARAATVSTMVLHLVIGEMAREFPVADDAHQRPVVHYGQRADRVAQQHPGGLAHIRAAADGYGLSAHQL